MFCPVIQRAALLNRKVQTLDTSFTVPTPKGKPDSLFCLFSSDKELKYLFIIGVKTVPGETQLTVICLAANSRAIGFTAATIAPFEAAYAVTPNLPMTDAIEDIRTKWQPVFLYFIEDIHFISSKALKAFIRHTSS